MLWLVVQVNNLHKMFRDPFLLSTPFLIYNLHLVLQFTSKIKIKSSQMAKWFSEAKEEKKKPTSSYLASKQPLAHKV